MELPGLSRSPSCPPSIQPSPSSPQASHTSVLRSRVHRIIRTPRNVFGLLRQYFSDKDTFPSHDPEEYIGLEDFCDNNPASDEAISGQQNDTRTNPLFHPYPNKNSFLLGDWYWNHGIQKSAKSFRTLLDIIGSLDFSPQDVSHRQWANIDKRLADDNVSPDDGDVEWVDEDAGWMKTPIKISVPFHQFMKKPGVQDYVVGDLYHRSLLSVIREKITNSNDNRHFHYDPYELFWKRTESSPDVRVYGELYMSPAFLDVQRELLESPGEPGCNLPRVVVALMFWSDATHLTSFGNAKLWPCYLFFGNESKYKRCKPTCHLCNHVAYFQTVSYFVVIILSRNV